MIYKCRVTVDIGKFGLKILRIFPKSDVQIPSRMNLVQINAEGAAVGDSWHDPGCNDCDEYWCFKVLFKGLFIHSIHWLFKSFVRLIKCM